MLGYDEDEYNYQRSVQGLPMKAPNPKNQIRGAKNRAQGEVFEKMITTACEDYLQEGQAYIEKTPEPFQIIGKLNNRQFRVAATFKAQPDYKGTLKGGRAICFEAKSATMGKILQERVTPTQLQALRHHRSLGAQVFVLVCLDFRLFCRVPLKVWETMKERYGHKHMTEKELEPFRLPFRGGRMDFLAETEFERGSGQ